MPLAVPRATVQGPTMIAIQEPKPWRQVGLKSWTGEGGGGGSYNLSQTTFFKKNLTTNHRQHLFEHSPLGRIVSQARPFGLRATPSGTGLLQSLYLGKRLSFPGGLLAPLSLVVTWRNVEPRAPGALLDSILLVPQLVQKCNEIWNLKVQLFWPLGENLGPKPNPRQRWIDDL